MEPNDADKTLETTPPPDATDRMLALDFLDAVEMIAPTSAHALRDRLGEACRGVALRQEE